MRILLIALCVCSPISGTATAADDQSSPPLTGTERLEAGREVFRKDVREILIHRCLECHGGRTTKADFDLSSSERLRESGLTGDAADESFLLTLVRHEQEPFMPFKKPKLSDAEIRKLERWIDLGAPYDGPLVSRDAGRNSATLSVTNDDRDFWSFQRLSAVTPPPLEADHWCRTEIDRFIGARLEAAHLKPNNLASRRTLIRRATFDLIGLPPSPAEVREFVSSDTPLAYEQLIDRLLASPHYGERWARHWLDVARFAESHGYEQDYDRPHAYHYRDFVIRALNADLPYDEFVRWQIAGDELQPDNPLAWMATGFLGAGVFPTQLTEAEFESARYDELDDMTATTGVAFLGLSIGCARCHDHKYDPIPTSDYYRFAAFFGRTIRSELELDLNPGATERIRADFAHRLSAKEARLSKLLDTAVSERFLQWLANSADEPLSGRWNILTDARVTSTAATSFLEKADGSWLARDTVPDQETVTFVAPTPPQTIRSLRLEALTDPSLPQHGPGRASNGNFALGHLEVHLLDGKNSTNGRQLKLTGARATHEQNSSSLSIAASIDDDPVSGWAVDGGGIGKDQAAVFDFQPPVTAQPGQWLSIRLTFHHPNRQHTLGRFRVSVTSQFDARAELGHTGPPASLVTALKDLRRLDNPQEALQWREALNWFAGTQSDVAALRTEIAEMQQQGPVVPLAKVQVSSEGLPHLPHNADGRGYPHFYPEVHHLERGDVHQKRDVASPGVLQVLTPPDASLSEWRFEPPTDSPRSSYRRAALARWLTDPESGAGHLLARVIVNRLWQHHFGRGLVATPNDFGLQGEPPTHPQLLEWLAHDFVTHGWRLKRLHKQILLSHVYMQNTDAGERQLAIDRENTLWWRRTPRRLEAEIIRDAMLSVSGMLDTRMYGSGSLDPAMPRRSVYFFIKRSQLIPMMMLFDWPEHLVSIGSRASTTTAPQALAFLNSSEVTDYATAFADRLDGQPLEDAIQQAFWLAFGRAARPGEQRAAVAFVKRQTDRHTARHGQHAAALALQDFCRAVFAMNEFIYID